jgi:hypothetical protein
MLSVVIGPLGVSAGGRARQDGARSLPAGRPPCSGARRRSVRALRGVERPLHKPAISAAGAARRNAAGPSRSDGMAEKSTTRVGLEPTSKETKRTSGELASQSWRFAARSLVGHDTVHPQPFPHDTPRHRPNRISGSISSNASFEGHFSRFMVLFRFELPRHGWCGGQDSNLHSLAAGRLQRLGLIGARCLHMNGPQPWNRTTVLPSHTVALP